MKLHPNELALAQAYTQTVPFEPLTGPQLRQIRDRGRALHRWFRAHPCTHALLNVAALLFLLLADAAVLLWLPHVVLPSGQAPGVGRFLLGGLLVGGLHGWLIYSLTAFSLHEGAAHRLIFPGPSWLSRLAGGIANNLCRLGNADPVYYAESHNRHHAKFGTADDGEFLNFIERHRFWRTLLPFGSYINYSDFVAHRPPCLTRSQQVSLILSSLYHGLYGVVMLGACGWAFTLLALGLIFPHVAFYLDRLRQFTEHNLMPLENTDGARSFGLGFWGMLIGGGPWGQPCHWMHHLSPGLPWYQQLLLHRAVKRLLTPQQRRQFLLQPVVGFPRLLWQLWRELPRFARYAPARPVA